MKKRVLFFGIIGAAALALAAKKEADKVEYPKYDLLQSFATQNIEIRQYEPSLIAEVEQAGNQHEALEAGFRILAGYIFGKNQSNQTFAPGQGPTIQKGEKIAMTSPFTAIPHGSIWKICFRMPSQFSLATLPLPTDDRIHFVEVPGERLAALRFSGLADEQIMEKKAEELETFLIKNNFKFSGEYVCAFYDPPWTLPFMRRNEVMFKLVTH